MLRVFAQRPTPEEIADPCDWRGWKAKRDKLCSDLDEHVRQLNGALLHANEELITAHASKISEIARELAEIFGLPPEVNLQLKAQE